ncbi:TPA: mitochondrial large ribosomal subunit protein uL15m [archaeon]|nr:mitochondrial large ribosomal subunit protein uL15m [Candidatus Undinarchaeales archaeon SRR5007147.bin71]
MSTTNKKIRKYRGRKTGGGAKKKRRGAGNRGGRGNAGRWDHKKMIALTRDLKNKKLKSIKTKIPVINLSQLNSIVIKDDLKEIDLSGYKVLGKGSLTKAISIKASSFSKSAAEKIKEIGGNAEGSVSGEERTSEPDAITEDVISENTSESS